MKRGEYGNRRPPARITGCYILQGSYQAFKKDMLDTFIWTLYIKCIFKRYIPNLSKAVHHLRISLATIIVSILLCFSCMFVVRRRFQETLPLTNLRNLNLYQQIRTNNALITLTVHNFVKIVTTVYLTSNDVKSQIAETSTIFQQLVQPSNNENMNTLHDSPFLKNNPPMIGELPSQNARMREEFPGHDVNIALC